MHTVREAFLSLPGRRRAYAVAHRSGARFWAIRGANRV
jgi:hypothetical protein